MWLLERMALLDAEAHFVPIQNRLEELFPTGEPLDPFEKMAELAKTLFDYEEAHLTWRSLNHELSLPAPQYPRWARVLARWEAKHR